MSLDQIRPLRGGIGDHVIPLRNDHRLWVRWPVTMWKASGCETLARTLARDRFNALLIFTPLRVTAGVLHWDSTIIFLLNFLAIVPHAALLNFAIDELSLKLPYFGGLINGIFGRPVDLIIGLVALKNNEISLVQNIMLGSIFFNYLLVLGSSFITGGMRYHEQSFNDNDARRMSSLMLVASASLFIPTTLYAIDFNRKSTLVISHGTAIILLCIYLRYLFFRIERHTYPFDGSDEEPTDSLEDSLEQIQEVQTLGPIASGLAIVILSVIAGTCATYLVSSVTPIVETSRISVKFFGIILIPIIGNVAELPTTCAAAWENKMGLVFELAIGNSIQIALFVTPLLVILSGIMEREMTLNFAVFGAILLLVVVSNMGFMLHNGKGHYLHGVMCLGLYCIVALTSYVYPSEAIGDIPPLSTEW